MKCFITREYKSSLCYKIIDTILDHTKGPNLDNSGYNVGVRQYKIMAKSLDG